MEEQIRDQVIDECRLWMLRGEEITGERSGAHVEPSSVDCSLFGSGRYKHRR